MPNEISIIEFTFEQGVTKKFHKMLKQNIPDGMSFECSVQTIRHQIDPGFLESNDEDHAQVIQEMIDFCKYNGDIVLFCEDSKIEQNFHVASWFNQKIR